MRGERELPADEAGGSNDGPRVAGDAIGLSYFVIWMGNRNVFSIPKTRTQPVTFSINEPKRYHRYTVYDQDTGNVDFNLQKNQSDWL